MSRRPPEDSDLDPTEFLRIDDAPTAASAPLVPYELGPGAIVGDYRIEGRIGEGGMGVVYSAVHPMIGKRAAIKVLQRELCTDHTALARFIDEARVVNKIGHPNIVDIFTLGQLPDGRSYLVMEWLAGETLRARIARSRPDLDETCYILRSLVRALDAAHEHGVVHRDLKPDNVFLVAVRGDRPMVKLLDFGIAKLVHADHRIDRTASNQMIGTPLYIAPEQAKAEVIDHRADIYALGAMAYEMIVGRPPFDGKSAMEVIAKHMMEPATRPSARVHGIPPQLDEVVYAMLAKEPGRRPSLADFSAVVDHLASAMQLAPVQLRGSLPAVSAVPPTIGATVLPAQPLAATAYTMPANTRAYAPATTSGAAAANAVTGPRPVTKRRWLFPVLGGVACAIGGVVIAVVVASSGGTIEVPRTTKPIVEPPVEPPKVEPPKVEPVVEPPKVEPPKVEPVEPAKVEPAKVEPAKVEPTKVEPAKVRPKPRPRVRPKPGEEEELLAPGTIPRGRQ